MMTMTPDIKSYPLTTVIATLGRDSLVDAVEALNRGTIVPDEILICIPANEFNRVSKLNFPNVKIITTDKKGQVSQRLVGFKNATHDTVMQLDDDVCVGKYCIESLLKTLEDEGPLVAVAPCLLCMSTGDSAFKINEKSKLLAIYYLLINGKAGFQPGTIGLSGVGFGVDPQAISTRIFNAEWLPGGCVMHKRENLVLADFYPFKGKAYNEDLIHSCLLRERGCRLIVNSKAHCFVEKISSSSYGPLEFLNNLAFDYRASKYFVKLSSRSYVRMNFHFMARILSYFGKILIKWCSRPT